MTDIHKDLMRLESVLHSARLGIWDWFITSGAVVFNDDWKTMVGYNPKDLPDNITTWENLIHPDDKDMVYHTLNQHLAGESEHYSCEHRLLHKLGHYIWILDTGKVVEYIEGKPYRATGIHQDITTRKELEFNLKKALESKDAFMASISHDINNLLNCISLPGQIIKLRDKGQQYTEQINMILKSTDALSGLLTDIMEYVKCGQDNVKLNNTKEDLVEIANDVIALLRPLADQKCIHLSLCSSSGPIYVYIDRQRFSRVMSNLVSNSIKYGKQGGYVKINLAYLKDAYFQVMVEDNGIGMTAAMQAKLFIPFERGDGHSDIKGYGLGMSIVDRIVRLMSGNIEVWSEPNLGTNVMITIPQTPQSPQSKKSDVCDQSSITLALPSCPSSPSHPTSPSPCTVLYAEDNDAHYNMITSFLDFHFIRARDGDELVRLATSVSHDIIVTDIMMPNKTGDAAVKELRDNGYTGPILAVTGNVYKDDIMRYYSVGIDKVISKPYRIEVLSFTVNELVHNRLSI